MIKQKTASEIWRCYEEIKRGKDILKRISETVESEPDPENDHFGRNSYQLQVPMDANRYEGHSLVGINPRIAKAIVEGHIAEMETMLKILNEKVLSEQHTTNET